LLRGREVVLDRGFNGCGVQDITDAAGVPKGSFYNYFDSKEAFAAEILEEYWQSIEDRHGPILYDARMKPLARVVKFFSALSEDHRQCNFAFGCLIGNLSLELSNHSEGARQKLSGLFGRWGTALSETLHEAQERAELPRERDVEEVAAIMVEAYEGAVMRAKVEQSGSAFDRFENAVLPRLLA
jgi:TetR/AcrR family transcriptional repressor of nem operon